MDLYKDLGLVFLISTSFCNLTEFCIQLYYYIVMIFMLLENLKYLVLTGKVIYAICIGPHFTFFLSWLVSDTGFIEFRWCFWWWISAKTEDCKERFDNFFCFGDTSSETRWQVTSHLLIILFMQQHIIDLDFFLRLIPSVVDCAFKIAKQSGNICVSCFHKLVHSLLIHCTLWFVNYFTNLLLYPLEMSTACMKVPYIK